MARRSGAAARGADHGPEDTGVHRLLQRDPHGRRRARRWRRGAGRARRAVALPGLPGDQVRRAAPADEHPGLRHGHPGAPGAVVRARSRVPGRAVHRDAADRREGAARRAALPHRRLGHRDRPRRAGGHVVVRPGHRGPAAPARRDRAAARLPGPAAVGQARPGPAARLLRALHELGLPGPEADRDQGSGLAERAPARRAERPGAALGRRQDRQHDLRAGRDAGRGPPRPEASRSTWRRRCCCRCT